MSSGGPERIVEPEEILQGGAQICPGGLAGYLPGHGTTANCIYPTYSNQC